ncbi:capsid protein [Blackfly DNA Virus 10]|nr:capsid protein [Blackfly DNA Virus 10]
MAARRHAARRKRQTRARRVHRRIKRMVRRTRQRTSRRGRGGSRRNMIPSTRGNHGRPVRVPDMGQKHLVRAQSRVLLPRGLYQHCTTLNTVSISGSAGNVGPNPLNLNINTGAFLNFNSNVFGAANTSQWQVMRLKYNRIKVNSIAFMYNIRVLCLQNDIPPVGTPGAQSLPTNMPAPIIRVRDGAEVLTWYNGTAVNSEILRPTKSGLYQFQWNWHNKVRGDEGFLLNTYLDPNASFAYGTDRYNAELLTSASAASVWSDMRRKGFPIENYCSLPIFSIEVPGAGLADTVVVNYTMRAEIQVNIAARVSFIGAPGGIVKEEVMRFVIKDDVISRVN